MGVTYRLPILSGIVQMIVSYLLTLAMVFVLALIVNGLAPTFGGTKDSLRALKLVAYGTTASFLGGDLQPHPGAGAARRARRRCTRST